MTPKALNIIGLIFGMIGVAIIFVWGPPQPNFHDYGYLIINDEDTERGVAETAAIKKRYSVMSAVGLISVIIGFGFQLWATFKSPGPVVVCRDNDNRSDGEHGNHHELNGLVCAPHIARVNNCHKSNETDVKKL